MSRTLAIGDIHGCSVALDALLTVVAPAPHDIVITLGDYVDRGPDSKGVLERLLRLDGCTQLVPLIGNHDEMMLEARDGRGVDWQAGYGEATIASYGGNSDEISRAHWAFRALPRLVRDPDTHFRARQHRVEPGHGATAHVRSALDKAPCRCIAASLGKDAGLRPREPEGRPTIEPRPRRVHRHVRAWRRLVDVPGAGLRSCVDGQPARRDAERLVEGDCQD
jgi:hypothetical protein